MSIPKKLTAPQARGLAYFAQRADRSLPPVKGFTFNPRIIEALLRAGLIDKITWEFGGSFGITPAGVALHTALSAAAVAR
jgi:hypothetical protein